jgi:hypothetical protein
MDISATLAASRAAPGFEDCAQTGCDLSERLQQNNGLISQEWRRSPPP